MRSPYLLIAPAVLVIGLIVTPTAAADCVTTGNTTLCSFGDSNNSGPYVPYPCEYDYDCNDYCGWQFDLDADPGAMIETCG